MRERLRNLFGRALGLLTPAALVSSVFVGALAALGIGCWMAWPPLGLIVPAGLVLALMILDRFSGGGRSDA